MTTPPGLSAPGGVSYESPTTTISDGTWDASSNTFLLPNLVGLNFDTMRYNGMGNRFRQQPGYSNLIIAHGIIATITFLFIVPSAILIMRFSPSPYRVRVHVWLQILTVLLATVTIALGFDAVGPSRRFTNPHHGIGFAIYMLILFQFLLGWRVHRQRKQEFGSVEPLKITLHHWLGRFIALLGLAQIPLGLTLYGSPKYLFGLYAAITFLWTAAYFHLSRRQDVRDSEYVPQRSGSRRTLEGVLAGAGLGGLAHKMSNRSRTTEQYHEAEKHGQHSPWQRRLLTVAAAVGAAGLVKKYLDRRSPSQVERPPPRPLSGQPLLPYNGASPSNHQPPQARPPLLPYGTPRPHTTYVPPPQNHQRRPSTSSSLSYSYDLSTSDESTVLPKRATAFGGMFRNMFKNKPVAPTVEPPRPSTSDTIAHPTHADELPALPPYTHFQPRPPDPAPSSTEDRERRRQQVLPLGGIVRPVSQNINPAATTAESITTRSSSSVGQASPSRGDQNPTSPPLGVRVKLHKDGRHVTVHRMPQADRSGREDDLSSLGTPDSPSRFRRQEPYGRGGTPSSRPYARDESPVRTGRTHGQYHRRNEALESHGLRREDQSPSRNELNGRNGTAEQDPRLQTSGILSPATFDGMATDVSTEYANNRQRRRAERARIRAADEARPVKTVGFQE